MKDIKAHIKNVIETHRFLRQDYQHKLEVFERDTPKNAIHRVKGIGRLMENITRHKEIMRVLEELIEDVWGLPQKSDEIDIDIYHEHSQWSDSIRIKHSQWNDVRDRLDDCIGEINYFLEMDLLQAYKLHGDDRDVDGNTENFLKLITPVDPKKLQKIIVHIEKETS